MPRTGRQGKRKEVERDRKHPEEGCMRGVGEEGRVAGEENTDQPRGEPDQTGWGRGIKVRGAPYRREGEGECLKGARPLEDQGKHCRKLRR